MAVCDITTTYDASNDTYTLSVSGDAIPSRPCAIQTQAWFSDGQATIVPLPYGVQHHVEGDATTAQATITKSNDAMVTLTTTWLGQTDVNAL